MGKSWLYTFNYKDFNFQDLDNEISSKINGKGKNSLIWFKYGNKSKDKNKLKTMSYSDLSKDDYVYIRFKNLPDNISRIMLRIKVKKIKDDNGFLLIEEEKDIPGYYFKKCIGEVEWIYNNDINKFSLDSLHNNYNVISNHKIIITNENNNNLLQELEFNIHPYSELIELHKRIKTCEFQDYYQKLNHRTFTCKSGLPYREGHHFVLQSYWRNCDDEKIKKQLEELIYKNTCNNILICPICHRMIHNGEPEEVKKMVNYLLENVKGLKENTNKVSELLGKTTEELICEMYNIK